MDEQEQYKEVDTPQPEQPHPVEPPPPHSSLIPKLFALTGLVFFIGAISYVGLYFYQNTQDREMKISETAQENTPVDHTTSWQIYRNEEFGFEFKYPEPWYITICDAENIILFNTQCETDIANNGFIRIIDIASYNDKLIEIKNYDPFNQKENIIEGVANIDGIGAEKITWSVKIDDEITDGLGENPSNNQSIVLKNNGYAYEIHGKEYYRYNNNVKDLLSNDYTLENFNRILSTFKFIEPKATTSISQVKTNKACEADWNMMWSTRGGTLKGMNIHICGSDVSLKVRELVEQTERTYKSTLSNEMLVDIYNIAESITHIDVTNLPKTIPPNSTIIDLYIELGGYGREYHFLFDDKEDEFQSLYEKLQEIRLSIENY